MSRDDDLMAFLRRGMERRFAWGTCDCALWCCDWIQQCRGVDPAAALRGTYATREDCAALLGAEGGLQALATRLFDAAGLVPGPVAPGAVGLLDTALGPLLALSVGDTWVGKSPQGVSSFRRAATLVWTV